MAEGEIDDSRSIVKASAVGDPRSPEIDPREHEQGQSGGNRDPVEDALAKALTEASMAGRFDVVTQLARELEARRLARTTGNVVDIGTRRRGRT
jgi:hypothetical protein